MIRIILLGVVFIFLMIACTKEKEVVKASSESATLFMNVIPKPLQADTTGFAFLIDSETTIQVVDGAKDIADILADRIEKLMGKKPKLEIGLNLNRKYSITLSIKDSTDLELGKEGYELSITPTGVMLEANELTGLFYGVETLDQLLPISSDSTQKKIQIATGFIRDVPTYAWRGAMLDVSRHFFEVDDVKKYIDYLSFYKMNVLHLHLSDDQGWRIEIKSWPNLTKHGGSTEVGGGEGGYYTQEQYKDLIDYASKRFVTIVPEIDLPGHTNAALASYGELNCNGKATELYTGTEVGFSTLCLANDVTFKFVDEVLGEIAALTSGDYLHIGGDEAAATKKNDYITFVNRFHEIVKKHNKVMIGWDEIAQGNIDSMTVVQHWHSKEFTQMALDKGARIILSPANKVYLDMKYDSTTTLGLKWAGYIKIKDAYDWLPESYADGATNKLLGVEAPLWTETIDNMPDLEYLVFPRLLAIAEVAWTPSEKRHWEDFSSRLGRHAEKLNALGIHYFESPAIPWNK